MHTYEVSRGAKVGKACLEFFPVRAKNIPSARRLATKWFAKGRSYATMKDMFFYLNVHIEEVK